MDACTYLAKPEYFGIACGGFSNELKPINGWHAVNLGWSGLCWGLYKQIEVDLAAECALIVLVLRLLVDYNFK